MRGFELTFARRGITIYGMKPLKEKLIRFPVYQWLEIGFCLCFVGGFLDAYTYVSRGGVFANAQTGNLVLLALGFARGDGLSALRYLVPILLFIVGVYASELFLHIGKKHDSDFQGHGIILIAEIAVLFVVGFLPHSVPDMLVNAFVSFVAAIQFDNFRKMEGLPFATAFCTGNLRSSTEQAFRAFSKKEKGALFSSLKYLIVIGGFLAGVFGGYFATVAFDGYASFFPCAVLLLVFAAVMLGERLRRKLTAEAERSDTQEEPPLPSGNEKA